MSYVNHMSIFMGYLKSNNFFSQYIRIDFMAFEFNLLQWLQAITGVDRDAKVLSSAS